RPGDFLLQRIGRERRQQRASPRQYAENRAEPGAAQDRAGAVPQIGEARPYPAQRAGDDARLLLLFAVVDDLRDAVDRNRDRHELDAVGKPHHAEIEPPCARIHVRADETEKQTEHDHRDRFDERSVRQNPAATKPHTISEKYSAGPNCKAMAASGGAASAISSVETQPAKNEPSAAMPSAGPARPRRAIWWPSMVVTTEDASPGRSEEHTSELQSLTN